MEDAVIVAKGTNISLQINPQWQDALKCAQKGGLDAVEEPIWILHSHKKHFCALKEE